LGYVLGVDLGTTYSAAAIESGGRAEIVQLGSRAAAIPSVVVLRADGEVLTGEAAERRSLSEPERTAREFKRRLGDPTPLILGGTPFGAETVMGHLLRAILKQVAEQRGEAPEALVITHPASYGPYKLDLLAQAARQADAGGALFVSEPAAAAIHYASQERVENGTIVAVYDFGGGTFDATILKKTDDGFELLGQPEGMERLGGIDFDEAVFRHVLSSLGEPARNLNTADPAVQSGLARLRDHCRDAKEALSADTEAVIPVLLPGLQPEVRITRSEFEALISPRLKETVAALERAARSAGISVEQIDRILLVGGSSRIPLVGAVVRELTGRPVAVDAHPKHVVALGAAQQARAWATDRPSPVGRPSAEDTAEWEVPAEVQGVAPTVGEPPVPEPIAPVPAPVPAAAAAMQPAAGPAPAAAASTGAPVSPAPPSGSGGGLFSNRFAVIGGAVVGLVAAGALIPFLFMGGDDDDEPGPAAPTGQAATPNPTTPATPSTTAPTAATAATATLAPNTSRITSIQVVNGRYSVVFETGGFQPVVTAQHVHFFFNTVPPANAGVPASGPWFVYGGPSPFTGYSVAEKPAAATQMCVLVANADHSVRQGTGNCIDLPQ